MSSGKHLIIIGAGPKAMAIAAKNSVLREMGFSVPEIHIIERNQVGANWTGDAGFTNGQLALGTSPEKDVGFPYQSTSYGESYNALINHRMQRFTWQSYLVDQSKYSDWVDRGRPAPCHRQWASYLQWVCNLLCDSIRFYRGEVNHVSLSSENRWVVGYQATSGRRDAVEGDGIVLTGPGKIRLSEAIPVHDNVFTVESFWRTYSRFRDAGAARLAIVGTGENAAAIAMALRETGNRDLRISILSPTGMAYSRGESFRENRVYSNADNGKWGELSVADRRNFIYRTDRGVFSQYAQAALDHADNIEIEPGRVKRVVPETGKSLRLEVEYDGNRKESVYDYVVVATGADQLAFFRDLIDQRTCETIRGQTGLEAFDQSSVEFRIEQDLSVQGLTPRLHLPMLSGVAQGPGFANLSCLGRLSDRILLPYLTK